MQDNLLFYRKQVARTKLKEYPLFNDFDDYGRLKPVCTRNKFYEVNKICCGDNFQVFLTNNGDLYTCGSNKFGQLGTQEDSDEDHGAGSGDEQEEGQDKTEEDNEVSMFMDAELQKKVESL